jgi:3-methyladenine DNA glycosylase/8-oxoguanine DNA glycosylase
MRRHSSDVPNGVDDVSRSPAAREHMLTQLQRSDPILARLIRERPGFDPRSWLEELPPMDLFGALVFQVIGQQLSVQATRRILDRILALGDGQMVSPSDLLAKPKICELLDCRIERSERCAILHNVSATVAWTRIVSVGSQTMRSKPSLRRSLGSGRGRCTAH